jgi:hypothetical protein
MRIFGYGCSLAALLMVAGLASAGGDDDAAARAVIVKAIKANGGEDNLAKAKAVSYKGSGKIHIGGDTFTFNAVWDVQWPAQTKFVVDVSVNGMNIQIVKVVNGDKGWQKIMGGDATQLTKDELAAEKHGIYTTYLQTLVPLKDKAFKLSVLGDVKVNDQDAIGICVTRKDQRDVNLYFDKKTHLLVKVESRVDDQGKEVNEEYVLGDHKMVDGVPLAHKITVLRDGKNFIEADLTEVRIHAQTLDNSIFQQP